MQKLVREGYEVEGYVRQFFEHDDGRDVSFQEEFKTDDGLYARVDALETRSNGTTALYEIKSSTSVKTDNKHNHIKDACFQKICAERAGQKIDRVFLVHLNGKYIREGEINPSEMLVFADITEAVKNVYEETSEEIEAALEFLISDQKLEGCSCVEKTRSNHCDAFSILNPDIPALSIYSLPRISAGKISEFRALGIVELDAVPGSISLTDSQRLMVNSFQDGEPKVDKMAIKTFLSALNFPLYFLDYETFSSAVPLLDGASPHKHFPVQYSLHILEKDGSLSHRDYLEKQPQLPKNLIKMMQDDIGEMGSIVSWHASFEKTQNLEMSVMFPDAEPFLHDISQRMVDLEDVFKIAYVDARFGGSTSIKKVLPVICPSLNYDDLQVTDGSSAMEAWQRMINSAPDESKKIASDLLMYCERDTFAMVEIYRFLIRLING